jgi:hypothetical protein
VGSFPEQIDEYNLEALILKMEILRDEISFALNNVDIDDEQALRPWRC